MTEVDFPRLDPVGLDGLLIRFADSLSEPANRAALAFRGAVDKAGWGGVEETATSLVSTFVRFDPLVVPLETLARQARALLATRDWYAAALPQGRRLLRIPTVYGTELAPQLTEAAQAAGLDPDTAVADLSRARTRVTTIGFAPGQPYLGTLPEAWNIPRQTALTPQVPVGALVVAIRQFVLFSVSTPTGWRHVGQTHARLFRPESDQPFLLRPGDEVEFPAISREVYENMGAQGADGIEEHPL